MHCRRDQRGSSPPRSEKCSTPRRGAGQGAVTHVLERLATAAPKVCELLEAAEEDLIAFYAFPPEHTELRSTNPLERSTRKRRAPTSSDLPQRRRRDPARRRAALRTERRMARAAPLPVVESMALVLAAEQPARHNDTTPTRRCPVSPPPETRAAKSRLAATIGCTAARPEPF